MVDVICIGLVERRGTRSKSKVVNEKFLPRVGLDPTTSRLLDWRSNQLRHGTDLMLDFYL